MGRYSNNLDGTISVVGSNNIDGTIIVFYSNNTNGTISGPVSNNTYGTICGCTVPYPGVDLVKVKVNTRGQS